VMAETQMGDLIPSRLGVAREHTVEPQLRRLRVAILAPDPVHEGGVTRAVAGWRQNSLDSRVDVEVITVAAWDAPVWKQLGQTVRALGTLCLRLLLPSRRPDVVHLNVSIGGSLYRKLIAHELSRLARVPTIVHLHSGDIERWVSSHSIHAWAARRLLTGTGITAVLTHQWIATVRGLGAARVAVVPGALSPELVAILERTASKRTQQAKARARRDTRVFLFYGRWSPVKGLDVFAEALNRLPYELLRRVELRIFGNGDREWLEEVFVGLNGPRLKIGGWLSDRSKEREFVNADTFVLPSRAEGFAQALVEAMHVGIPIIGSDAGGIPEVLSEYPCARIVPKEDPHALARALREVIEDEWPQTGSCKAAIPARLDRARVVDALLEAYHAAVRLGTN
jgi:glycosyltransferase involved in cell wall biosynthesis